MQRCRMGMVVGYPCAFPGHKTTYGGSLMGQYDVVLPVMSRRRYTLLDRGRVYGQDKSNASAHQEAYPWPPRPPEEASSVWTEEMFATLDATRRIFCNRTLNMGSIKCIGFDMDYTLASYKPETFESLAHEQTVKKLVQHFGYPKSLYDLTFDYTYMARGLVIDKEKGNILKVDRHKYVKLAHHGFTPLTREERMEQYNSSGRQFDFEEPGFALIDTLFSLAEAHLFMQLVEMMDANEPGFPTNKTYADLYREVRGAVDLCHRDGSIKKQVAKEPEKYLYSDPGIVAVLDMMRQSGKKVFLATNSLFDYTHVVMNWLIEGKVGKERDNGWLSYFDVVVTGCGKPRFFTERKDLFEVDPERFTLVNTEGGSPMIPLDEDDVPRGFPVLESTAPEKCYSSIDGRARVFQGGSYLDLHKMLGIRSGTEILYVGDHIYGDVLRSKRDLGWRTLLVIPELEAEIKKLQMYSTDLEELEVLQKQRNALEDRLQRLEWMLQSNTLHSTSDDEEHQMEELVRNLRHQNHTVQNRHKKLLKKYHEAFHPIWGQLFKTGYKNSRYAHQTERFACIYTSHVSNLMFYSPMKNFKARMDAMVHDSSSKNNAI